MNKTQCPHCKSQEVVKRGFFNSQAHGKQQRYFCNKCNKKFIEQSPFYRMKNSPQKITLCLDLFYRGISTRKIQEHLQAFYPHNSSWVSIYNWIVRYSEKISKFTDKLKIKTGNEIQVDEVEFHRRKQRDRKGVDKNWFIDGIDTETRYMVSSEFVKARENKEIKAILKHIKNKTTGVEMLTTDGHAMYLNAVKKVFGYDKAKQRYNVLHNVVNASQGEGFNIKIERLHNTIRHRTKTFRGFHGSIKSAKAIMKGFEIYYNFIRQHLALKGKTPSELATDIKLKENNKWLELINLSD